MKTLLLMRHAKSSHDEEGLSDHERPLTGRGRRDAPRVAERLVEADLVPDRILCSTARRAKETAELFAPAAGFGGEVTYSHWLYHATPAGILDVIAEHGGDAGRLMVVGHNPGMEQLVRSLTGDPAHMPTAAVARIELPIDDWDAIRGGATGRLAALWKPKDEE
ncbi:MAG TPA: histidine phosphatase family protein [Planctomycetaceae bacterium]